ncbi:hypothetical protein GCM10007235_05240 [Pseudoxanthomonas indica]|nr:hypothetical protein GCM10007235_05240 [Pseudoxanthomonas indica]
MRFESVIFALAMGASMNACAGQGAINSNLTQSDIDSLETPTFTKQELSSGSDEFLVVTRNYGSGLELRDAYVYRRGAGGQWDMIAFRRTNSSRVEGSLSANRLTLTAKSGKVVLEVPIEPSGFKFDPMER